MKTSISLPFGGTLPFLPSFLLVACLLVTDFCVGQSCPFGYDELLFEDFEACPNQPAGWSFDESNPGNVIESDGWYFDNDEILNVSSPGPSGTCWAVYYEDLSQNNDRTATLASIAVDVSSHVNIEMSFFYGYDDRSQATNPNDFLQLWAYNPITGDELYYEGATDSWILNAPTTVWLTDSDAGGFVETFQIPQSIVYENTGFQIFIKYDDGGGRGAGFGIDDFQICGELCTLAISAPTPTSICGGNGEVSVNITTAGDGPYQISIDGIDYPTAQIGNTLNVTGLPPNTYNELTVTDSKGCKVTTSGFTIEAQPAIAFAPNGVIFNDATMCGGQGIVTIILNSAGTTPYDVLLDGDTYPNLTGTSFPVPQGTYNGIIQITDANGCTDTRSVNATVGEPPLSATIAIGNPSCGDSNGSVTATVAGTGPYTYQWNDPNSSNTATVSGLSSGTYQVVITDQGTNCTITEQSAMLVNQGEELPLLPFDMQQSGPCDSTGTLTVNHTMGDVVTYLWSDGQTGKTATGLAVGDYTVTVTNTTAGVSCISMGTAAVTAPPSNITITAPTMITNVTCPGGNDGSITGLVIAGADAPLTTIWVRDGGTFVSSDLDISGLIAGDYDFVVVDANNCRATYDTAITEPDAFDATYAITDVVCDGDLTGEIDLTVTGGTAPYTYFWGPNTGTTEDLTGLSAGSYFVTITDASACVFTSTTTIGSNQELTLELEETNPVSCNGGSDGAATVTATGVGGYTYLWDNGATTSSATGLTGGSHSVMVTDSVGCSKTSTVDIFSPEPISATTTNLVNASCLGASNGSATVSPTGGTAPYTYLWPDGQTAATVTEALDAVDYEVSITDANACTTVYTVSVGESAPLTPNASINAVSCNGESDGVITLNPSNGSGSYSYTWSTGNNTNTINNLPAGAYSITVEDDNANCRAEETYLIGEPDVLVLTADNPDNLCGASIITVTAEAIGGNSGYQYAWSDNSTGPQQNVNANQAYSVSVTDAKGCEAAYSFAIESLASPAIINVDSNFSIVDGEAFSISLDAYFDTDAEYDWTILKENPTVNPATYTTESGTTDDLFTQVFSLAGASPSIGKLIIEISSYLEDGGFRCDGDNLRLHVEVLPNSAIGFFLPEIITPNGDGYNDNFEILFTEGQDTKFYYYEIFNRNGARVFQSVLGDDLWDGGNNPDGIYYYRLYRIGGGGRVVAKSALTVISK